jgi:hypothetical protein
VFNVSWAQSNRRSFPLLPPNHVCYPLTDGDVDRANAQIIDMIGNRAYQGGATDDSTVEFRFKGEKKWRVKLPNDFLVLPSPAAFVEEDISIEDQDAMLAQILQDAMFLEQLRGHPDFADYLEQERKLLEQLSNGGGSVDSIREGGSSSGIKGTSMSSAAKSKLFGLFNAFRSSKGESAFPRRRSSSQGYSSLSTEEDSPMTVELATFKSKTTSYKND